MRIRRTLLISGIVATVLCAGFIFWLPYHRVRTHHRAMFESLADTMDSLGSRDVKWVLYEGLPHQGIIGRLHRVLCAGCENLHPPWGGSEALTGVSGEGRSHDQH
ncbi:MAG: hypothetical protein KDA96_04325, partial [Planctomycetaceae bacterium]|nr:hypothetical protein [Planctomycetaceae bacterium]